MTRTITIVGLAVLLATAAMAQNADQVINVNVTEGCILDITSEPVTFTVAAPEAAGNEFTVTTPPNAATNALKYTNISDGTADKITVKLDKAVPVGLQLTASATVGAAYGLGKSNVVLGAADSDIVTNIGSCANGSAPANITYALTVATPASVVAGNTALTALYTFVDTNATP